MSHLSRIALRALARRTPLAIDPSGAVARKRHVHEFVLDVPAARFARAFHETMTQPDAAFGRIEVRRDPERAGQPFAVGERFHGCISMERSAPRLRRAADALGLSSALTWIEDNALSDYSEIAELEESADAFRASYVYLSGCPLAGESRFEVIALGDRCRLEVVFEYQETNPLAVLVIQLFGASLHDDVVREQVRTAADRAGATIVTSTMSMHEPS